MAVSVMTIYHRPYGTRLVRAEWEAHNAHVDAAGNALKLSRSATYVIAASNAPDTWKYGADYLMPSASADLGAVVNVRITAGDTHFLLSPGAFQISTAIAMPANGYLTGTHYRQTRITRTADVSVIQIPSQCTEVEKLSIYGSNGSFTSTFIDCTTSGLNHIYAKHIYFENGTCVGIRQNGAYSSVCEDIYATSLNGYMITNLVGHSGCTYRDLYVTSLCNGVIRLTSGTSDLIEMVNADAYNNGTNPLIWLATSEAVLNSINFEGDASTGSTSTGILFGGGEYTLSGLRALYMGHASDPYYPIDVADAAKLHISGSKFSGTKSGAGDIVNPASGGGGTIIDDGSNTWANGIQFKSSNSGTGTIANGATSTVITHGLSYTPAAKDITITLTEDPTNTPGAMWVGTFTSTQFTVNCENDPGASGLDFSWAVRKT